MHVCIVENFCISVSLYTKAVILTEDTGGVAVCFIISHVHHVDNLLKEQQVQVVHAQTDIRGIPLQLA